VVPLHAKTGPNVAWQFRHGAACLFSVCDADDGAIVDTEVTTLKVVTVREFRDRASEMFRSEDVILVTRGGKPAGFFVPWDKPDLPIELKRELFAELTDRIGALLPESQSGESG
jgi:hypothetical protein